MSCGKSLPSQTLLPRAVNKSPFSIPLSIYGEGAGGEEISKLDFRRTSSGPRRLRKNLEWDSQQQRKYFAKNHSLSPSPSPPLHPWRGGRGVRSLNYSYTPYPKT